MRLSKPLVGGAMLAVMVTAVGAPEGAKPRPGQQSQVFEKQIMIHFDYQLFLPEEYEKDTDKKWPLILFLHGAGERGNNVELVKKHGPPKIVQTQKDFPFIVVSPQCPSNSWWEPYALKALLDDIQERYRVDRDRTYLTGLSMGGFGTWDLATRYPDRFAAIAPICGGGNPVLAGVLRRMPIWVFHGDADPVVPVQRSDEMVEALKKVGADVKYTRYPGVQHDSWTETYENEELYKWFLSHKRTERSATRPSR